MNSGDSDTMITLSSSKTEHHSYDKEVDVAMVFSMRNKKIDAFLPQTFASRIAITGIVSDHSLRSGPVVFRPLVWGLGSLQ